MTAMIGLKVRPLLEMVVVLIGASLVLALTRFIQHVVDVQATR